MDFELFWGVRDKRTLESYGDSIENVHKILPKMVAMFEEFGVKATFATVGFLFAKDKSELIGHLPKRKPAYSDSNLSPYTSDIDNLPESADAFHYAPNLLDLLKKYPSHEIASHTFSHYYCLEEGQNVDDFDADIRAAKSIAELNEIALDSLVFPRNQFNKDYLEVLKKHNISSYRGNERNWFHTSESESNITLKKRIFRTLNCYINIGGHHCYSLQELVTEKPYDIPSSRFLRPYQSKLPILEWLKLRRIKKSMTHAAKKGLLFHLWWHPHNFGKNEEQNFRILREILQHYQTLHEKYDFQSNTMHEIRLLLDQLNASN